MWIKFHDRYMDYVGFSYRYNGMFRRILFGYPGAYGECFLSDSIYIGEPDLKNLIIETSYGLPNKSHSYVKHDSTWDFTYEFERLIKNANYDFQLPGFIADYFLYKQWFENGVLIKTEE